MKLTRKAEAGKASAAVTEHIVQFSDDWRAHLSRKAPYPADAVACAGTYKLRYPGKDSPWCAVKIIEAWPIDEDGAQVGDTTFTATVNGAAVAVETVWPYCGRFPLPEESYMAMLEQDARTNGVLASPQPVNIAPQPDRTQSDEVDKLAAALAKAQGAVHGAVKDTANPFFKSTYADLASVWSACRAALSSNGLAVVQSPRNIGDAVSVVTTLMHESGQWIRGELAMRPLKPDPQGIGSAITYARRYALAAMVGVAPEDDDGERAMGRQTLPEPSKTASARTDEKLASATEWANALAGDLDKSKVAAYVNERLNEPDTVKRLKWLHDNHPLVYGIVERARERAVERIAKAA